MFSTQFFPTSVLGNKMFHVEHLFKRWIMFHVEHEGMTKLPLHIEEDFKRLKGDMQKVYPQEEIWSQLERYTRILVRWSGSMNLVSRRDLSTIATKHLRQALMMIPIVTDLRHKVIMDLGSGAGLPAIPMKIILSDSHFILVESRRKRANFLRDVVRTLGLSGIDIINDRVEHWAGWPGGVDIVTARAVASPSRLRDLVRDHLSPEGWILSPLDRNSSHNITRQWRIEEDGVATSLGLYR